MFRSLSLKLVVSLTASLIVILSFFGYRMIEMQRHHMEQITFEAADRISDSIESSILYSMQRNHREHIYHTIQTIGSEPGINKIRIFNEIGRISYSSDDSEIDSFVDKRWRVTDEKWIAGATKFFSRQNPVTHERFCS